MNYPYISGIILLYRYQKRERGKLMNWKNLFPEHTLERGRNYYYEGCVTELRKIKEGYSALVEGTI